MYLAVYGKNLDGKQRPTSLQSMSKVTVSGKGNKEVFRKRLAIQELLSKDEFNEATVKRAVELRKLVYPKRRYKRRGDMRIAAAPTQRGSARALLRDISAFRASVSPIISPRKRARLSSGVKSKRQ
jgi:hypothetical protein